MTAFTLPPYRILLTTDNQLKDIFDENEESVFLYELPHEVQKEIEQYINELNENS